MKTLLRLSLLLASALAFVYVDAAAPASYYSRLDGKKREALKTAAYETVRPHTVAEQARGLSLPTNTKETLPVRISIW